MFLELAIVAGVRLSPTKVTLLGGFRGICGKIKTRLVTLLHVTCYNKVVPHVAFVIYRVPTAYGDGLRGLQNTDITDAHGSIITDLLILSF